MRFQSFLKEVKKQRKKRKANELSNPVRKKIRVQNQNQLQVPSSPPPSLSSPLPHPSPLSLLSVPSSSSHNWTHDVFPSFRGEDVRIGFLSHIQKEFKRKGITPFIDNKIERGESIGPELIRAIRGSKIAIILLSENYASSKWCLDELVEIMKCKEELGQTVIPVFYKVDPSDVKKLRGYFGEVFEKTCEGKSKEDTEKWREALEKVATIAGYDSSTWDNEAAMIEEIATDVSNKLINSEPSSDFDSLVGMKGHMEKMEPFLHLNFDEVRMIGIWGPSGIGKSTIARFLFNQHSHDFQLSVFMEDIKRDYPRPGFNRYNAQLQLQKTFLSLILNQKDVTIHHLGVAPDRLKDKKVLVVLDDVDKSEQLNALAKELWWFGPGSRIIVTTQDKKVLNAHGINHIYEVGFPDFYEAREILCINAFGQKSPYDGFWNIAGEVTKLVGNLPLGLSVMGSYFKGLSKEEWDHELPRLRTRLNGDIENTLKFCYDGLCDEEQAVFLLIACFFNREPIEKVEEHLAQKISGVKSHLRVLAEKSLISINKEGYIEMHDLLARLGWEVVRKKSPNEPGQRQFLVDDGDIRQVLRDDTLGSRSVIGINFELKKKSEEELKINDGAFERMSNVQFVRLRCRYSHEVLESIPYIIESLKCLPREVRLLHWDHSPMTCLPSNFNPEFLVEINMSYSNLEKLWEGNKAVRNLKWMDLCNSINLKELPDFSTATNLRKLYLCNCSSLVKLPSSIGNMINLEVLRLNECSSLVELPLSIGNMTNLKILDLDKCSSLVELPSSIGNIANLEKLCLNGCSILVKLPSFIGNMTKLEMLDFKGYSSFVNPHRFGWNMDNLKNWSLKRCSSLVELPSSIGNVTNLGRLDLSECSSLVNLPPSIANISNLIRLYLCDCSSLVELPSSIGNMTNLEILDLRRCSSLVKLPSSIGNMTNIKELPLIGCSSLVELPYSIGNMTNLKQLNLRGCSSLVNLSSSIGNMTNLKILYLDECSSLVELPFSIGNMTNLKELNLCGCSSLVNLPSSIGNMTNLIFLYLRRCSSLVELPSSIGNMTNLKELDLKECSSLVELPSSIGNMTNLEKLDLKECSSLVKIPYSIGNMTIMGLSLIRCPSLVELPSSILNMTNLRKLDLSGCSSLVEFSFSIGNVTNVKMKDLTFSNVKKLPSYITNPGCPSLVDLPSSIGNTTNLHDLDLIGCSTLVDLPFSIGNINKLNVLNFTGCSSLVDLPSSVGNLHNLQTLYMCGCSKLKTLHALSRNIGVLILDRTAIEEILQSIRLCCHLHTMSIKGCTKLVSLPQLPDSLGVIDAENCESLERLDCSFYKTKFAEIIFINCFKLNEEARDLIIKASTTESALLPGETVPAYFTYRAAGSFLSMKLRLDTHFLTTTLRFKTCVLLVYKGGVEAGAGKEKKICYRIKYTLRGVNVNSEYSLRLSTDFPRSEHLVIIEFEITMSSPELVFELELSNEDWEIKEFGVRPLETLVPSC